MEYENMRLKAFARDRGLNYSQMRKAELVAFLTIWIEIIFQCADKARVSDKLV